MTGQPKPPTLREQLNKSAETLDNIVNVFNYQVIGNLDLLFFQISQSLREVVDPEKLPRIESDIKLLIENLAKSPIRKQVSRINGVQRVIKEFQPAT